MKLSFLLLPTLLGLASAKCYKSGERWDYDLAPAALKKACKALAKDYRVNDADWKDIDMGNGQCYRFLVQRISGGDTTELRSLTRKECKSGMDHELYDCRNGGVSYYKNWKYQYVPASLWHCKGRLALTVYRADPNHAPCQ